MTTTMAIMYLLIGIITGATIMLLWMKNKSTQELRKAGEELAALRSQLETERKNMDERIAAVKESSRNQIETERKHSEELRSELQKQALAFYEKKEQEFPRPEDAREVERVEGVPVALHHLPAVRLPQLPEAAGHDVVKAPRNLDAVPVYQGHQVRQPLLLFLWKQLPFL